ncbi:hypothetical protein BJ165DRAFT_1420112 [Panaeolus papilionaceus]|nr:hypothetical protein BJ165DRAFT_1420112 [Panaeolus papilionaceus]
MIDYDDPDPKSLKWRVTDLGHYTSTNGSKVVINFSGTQLRWYGFHEPSFRGSIEESTATYILDNYPSNTFTIPRISSAPSARQIGLPYLTTEELAPGMHRLEVTYASTTGRPLGLHHLVIQDAPLPSAHVTSQTQTPSARPSSTHNPLGNTPSPSAHKSGTRSQPVVIAITVNMVVGGLVLVGLAVFLWRRRRSKIIPTEAAEPYDPSIQASTDMPRHKIVSPGSLSSSATTPKGTLIEDLPLRRGSLHIRSLNDDETPPPYHQNINLHSR